MAAPLDNVIRFPDGARGSAAEIDRSRALVESRDLMAHKLREAFRALLPKIEEDLLAKGDVADGREQRQLYYGTKDTIHDSAARLEGLLAAKWLGLFEQHGRGADRAKQASLSANADELQLVDFGVMDEELAVKAVAGRLRDGCEEGLFAAGRRLAFLFGQPDDEASLPVEELISKALEGAFADLGLVSDARLELLRSIERNAVEVFGPAIHDLNAFMVGRGVLPRLRRSYARAAGNRKRDSDSAAAPEATDIFALLQKLVGAPPSGGVAGGGVGGASGPAAAGGGGAGGGGSGSGGAGGIPATMVVAMEQVMASLDNLQHMVPVQAAAVPTTNVLREFRSSDTGQGLGYLDAVTVDIVATLFDFIFNDASVGDPIKALVGRLQIPVLKVAMLDKSFFSSKAHPARRLLDAISRAAVRCGPQAGHEDPIYARIAEIVDRLQNEFAQDTGLFDSLCVELDAFLAGEEAAADARAERAAPLVAEQERRELAALAVDQALAGWLAMPLPSAVSDLLSHEWRSLLVHQYLTADDAAWGVAMGTVSDLVASVQPQAEAQGRKQLAARLPTLVRRIHDGLDSLKVPDDRRLALIDALFSLHAAVLRGAAPVVTSNYPSAATAQSSAPAAIASEHVEDGEMQLDCITLAEGTGLAPLEVSEDAQAQVADLQRGDWVEFANPEGGRLRFRLSWISPQRGILLFTNPQSPRAISVSPEALILQIERGEAAIVPVEPMFDRAVNRALETLQAA